MVNSIYDDGTYAASNTNWHTEDSEWKASQIVELLDDNKVSPATIADVGCGAGKVIKGVSRHFPNAECTGFDVSLDVVRFWEDGTASKVVFKNEDFLAASYTADLVLNIDVFEHVDDYRGFLRSLSKKAHKFVFHIPLEMHVSAILREQLGHAHKTVGHLHFFSLETALFTLKDTGYEVLDWHFTRLSQKISEGKMMKTSIMNIMRKVTEIFSIRLSSKLFGGYSLIVLCCGAGTMNNSDPR